MVSSRNDSDGDDLDDSAGVGAHASIPAAADRSLFSGLGDLSRTAMRLTGVDGAAIAMLTGSSGVRDLVHATDAMAYHLDELQFTLGEGPCLDVFTPGGTPMLIPDIAAEPARRRWPIFTAEARSVGVHAMFAFAITANARPLGVLELYRRTPGDLPDDARRAAILCADTVSTTIAQNWDAVLTRLEPGADQAAEVAEWLAADELLQQGANSRAQVYLASGMVAVQLRIPTAEAMARLRAYAYRTGRSIKDVADDVVARKLDMRGGSDGPKEDR